VDVFGLAVRAGGTLLRDAAIDCAHELGVFATHTPRTLDAIADAAGLGAGRRRLRPLLDVLVALGVLARVGDAVAVREVPARPVVVRAGWGLAAEVMRTNRALAVEGGALELRYHQHLLAAGAAPARELAPALGAGPLLDLGGGAGTYTRAYLAHHGEARATIVDFPEVIALARIELAELGDRVRYVAGEAVGAPVGDGFGVALLANVLHLHDAASCAALVAAAARAVAPGGLVVIKELRLDDDRAGPLEGLWFALNMALYTGGGDVYVTSQLRAWLTQAGLVELRELALATAADGICLVARKPEVA
jgi:SAM-dependent methyltransferase